MMQIETQLGQLRLHGMNQSWKALLETRRHNELRVHSIINSDFEKGRLCSSIEVVYRDILY